MEPPVRCDRTSLLGQFCGIVADKKAEKAIMVKACRAINALAVHDRCFGTAGPRDAASEWLSGASESRFYLILELTSLHAAEERQCRNRCFACYQVLRMIDRTVEDCSNRAAQLHSDRNRDPAEKDLFCFNRDHALVRGNCIEHSEVGRSADLFRKDDCNKPGFPFNCPLACVSFTEGLCGFCDEGRDE